LTENVVVAEL